MALDPPFGAYVLNEWPLRMHTTCTRREIQDIVRERDLQLKATRDQSSSNYTLSLVSQLHVTVKQLKFSSCRCYFAIKIRNNILYILCSFVLLR